MIAMMILITIRNGNGDVDDINDDDDGDGGGGDVDDINDDDDGDGGGGDDDDNDLVAPRNLFYSTRSWRLLGQRLSPRQPHSQLSVQDLRRGDRGGQCRQGQGLREGAQPRDGQRGQRVLRQHQGCR